MMLSRMTTLNALEDNFDMRSMHRCDSIRGTDYIANPFFLELKSF